MIENGRKQPLDIRWYHYILFFVDKLIYAPMAIKQILWERRNRK